MTEPSIRLLSAIEAAGRLGLSVDYLKKLRQQGGGPAFIKLGVRRIAYDPADLATWCEARKRSSTSDQGGAK